MHPEYNEVVGISTERESQFQEVAARWFSAFTVLGGSGVLAVLIPQEA
jgi:hypothetical protein